MALSLVFGRRDHLAQWQTLKLERRSLVLLVLLKPIVPYLPCLMVSLFLVELFLQDSLNAFARAFLPEVLDSFVLGLFAFRFIAFSLGRRLFGCAYTSGFGNLGEQLSQKKS